MTPFLPAAPRCAAAVVHGCGQRPFLNRLHPQTRLEAMGYHRKSIQSWGAAEAILVNPKTGLLERVNHRRRPAGQAAGY